MVQTITGLRKNMTQVTNIPTPSTELDFNFLTAKVCAVHTTTDSPKSALCAVGLVTGDGNRYLLSISSKILKE